jgi:hypothetical protein
MNPDPGYLSFLFWCVSGLIFVFTLQWPQYFELAMVLVCLDMINTNISIFKLLRPGSLLPFLGP